MRCAKCGDDRPEISKIFVGGQWICSNARACERRQNSSLAR